MGHLDDFRRITRTLDARFEGKELVEADTKPAPFTKCAERVKRGASMVRGLQRYGPCEKDAVFVAPDGKAYCGTHGVAHGYTPPAKPEKKSWLVFYTRPDGKKSFRYSYDKVNEKGVRMAWKRQNPDDKIDGIIPYDGDAAFEKSAEYPKWKEWWESWKKESLEEAAASDPKKAVAKLLKAAEKELKPLASATHVWQETITSVHGYGPYEQGSILVGDFKVEITVDLKSGVVSIGTRSGPHVLETLSSRGTLKDAAKRLKKPLDFIKERLAEKAQKAAAATPKVVPGKLPDLTPEEWTALEKCYSLKPHDPMAQNLSAKGLISQKLMFRAFGASPAVYRYEPTSAGETALMTKKSGADIAGQMQAVKEALHGKKTAAGGRLNYEYMSHNTGSYPSISFEPENRERLDHYGNEGEGWDDEGWEADYAGPLAKEVEALLQKAGISKDWVVDIGEKGHVHVQLSRKSK